MNLLSVFFIAVGLSMDACAVSFAKGICLKSGVRRHAVRLAAAFGFFQGLMPLLGWWVGTHFESFITSVDHWIAFALLSIIGINDIVNIGLHFFLKNVRPYAASCSEA